MDAQSFFDAYSQPEKFEELYSYASTQNLTDLNKDVFYDAYFGSVKKNKSFSDSVQQQNLLDSLYGAEGESIDLDLASLTSPNPDAETNFIGGKLGDYLNKASAFATASNSPVLAEVIDFADDMARSFYIGQGQGSTIDETLALMTAGSNVDRETLKEYIDATAPAGPPPIPVTAPPPNTTPASVKLVGLSIPAKD